METNNKKSFVMPAVVVAMVVLLVGTGYLATREDTVKAPTESVSTSTPKTTTSVTPSTSTKTDVSTKTQVIVPIKIAPATNVSVSGKSSIEILSPDGGNGFAIDASNLNASIPVSLRIADIKGISIYLIDALGKTVSSASFPDATENESSFIFRVNKQKNVGSIRTGDYKIKVCDIKNLICNTSEKSFKITSFTTEPASVTIISPNGGEIWKIGSKQTISFETAGDIKPEYKLVLTLESKQGAIATVSATSTSYSWTVPKEMCWAGEVCGSLLPAQYKIKATIYDGDEIVSIDESNMSINIIK